MEYRWRKGLLGYILLRGDLYGNVFLLDEGKKYYWFVSLGNRDLLYQGSELSEEVAKRRVE